MESVIGKAIDLVCEYTVVPIVRQLKYVFFYKSCVAEMKDAIQKLENDKEIVDREKTAAMNNGQLIHHKADDWLDEATKAKDEVSSLMSYEEEKAKMSGCVIGAQILNPIARHKLGRKATKKKLAIEDIRKERPQHDDISYAPPPPGIVDPAEPTASAKQLTVYDGIFRSSRWEEILEKIMKVLKDDRFNVTGLHGMGGVGKSTMINEVYNQVKKQCMFDEVVKIEVKVKPEVKRLQEEIAFALGLKFENDSTTIRADLLRDRLLKTEKKKSVLIILDDLWEKLDLQEVGIPIGGTDQVQIKLFLTSREEYLLSDKMGARELVHLNVLSDADALKMFMFVVGVGAECVKDDIVIEIARKCSGLPIVIEAIAKSLKDRALDEWEKIMKRLENNDVLKKLQVSYDYLPNDGSRDFFLICGISRGPSILVSDLLKYTFGLRLYNKKDSSTLEDATTKLEGFLSRLEAASMLLKRDDSRYVKIHDRMRELAFKIVKEDRPEWVHDIILSDNGYKIPHTSKSKLLLSCCEGVVELQDSFLKDMEQLNVLEFTNVRVSLPLPSSTTQLDYMRNLGTLCLHSCCLVDISMIGELKGLQILSFRGSDICKLPRHLKGLTALMMLDLSDCDKLTEIEPNVLGSFTNLEELNMENSFNDWEIGQEDDVPPSNARLVELKNMSRLSNVRIHIPRTSMLPKEGNLFSSNLSMYRIMVGDYYRDFSDEYTKFSRVLMLTLDEYSSDIVWQEWVQTTLQTVEALYLSRYVDGKCETISDVCNKGFECLKHLRMENCSFRYIISLNGSSLMNLESLVLVMLESLESLCDELPRHKEVFNKLRVVKATYCNKLTHLFDFSLLKTRLSSQLEEITVENCDEIQSIVVGEVDSNYDIVTLSNSQKLKFKSLPKFSSFYGGASSNVLFTGKKVAFPCLESLIIEELDELEHIWHPSDPPAVLGNLRFLEVKGCDKLVRVINSNVLMRLQRDLEYLNINNCGLMKEVFDVDDGIISSYRTDDEHHLVLFSQLKTLWLYDMDGIIMMMMNGGMSSITILPNIESLYVWDCGHLRYVLYYSLPSAGVGGGGGVYENLKQIHIDDCDEMEAIVAVVKSVMVDQETSGIGTTTGCDAHHHQNNDAVSYSYSSLKEMMIRRCGQLKTFCQYLSSQQVSFADDLPFFSQKEIYPCMESLHFEGLSKLGEIWPREVPHQTSLNMLRKIEISHCPELSVLFPSTLIERLENLTDIKVQHCDQMIQIVHVDEEESVKMMFTFPCLISLFLEELPKLDGFYSSPSACGFQFPSLETLRIRNCGGVKRYTAIPNLNSIDLYGLEDLTKIWNGEKAEGLIPKLESLKLSNCSPSCTNFQSLLSVGVAASLSSWSVLTQLTVEYCDGLEYMLTPHGATSLVHLTILYIRHCKNMKQVLAIEEDEAASSNEENQGGIVRSGDHIRDITFRHLKKLELESLRRLEKFSSVNNMVLNFPSLEIFGIWRCPNITTFSGGSKTTSTQKFGDLNSFLQKDYIEDRKKMDNMCVIM